MANSNRLAKSYLAELSQSNEELHQQGFEPLIRYLEANAPLAQRVGYSVSPKQDFVRFGQTPLLHFFPAAFTNSKFSNESGYYKLRNSYFGMLGINGPLPIHLTEYALERSHRHKDNTFSEFLDVFNHRFISLFYRAWADSQPAVSHDRPEEDSFKNLVGAIAGHTETHSSNLEQNKQLDHYLSGLLSHKNRSASVLEQLLSEFLSYPVSIKEFEGAWYPIQAQDTTHLGQQNSQLGLTTTLGEKTFQRSFKFRIDVGPMDYEDYISLIDNPAKFARIEQLTRNTVGQEFEYDIFVYLNKQQSKAGALGQARLGIDSWSQDKSGHLKQLDTLLVYRKEGNFDWQTS